MHERRTDGRTMGSYPAAAAPSEEERAAESGRSAGAQRHPLGAPHGGALEGPPTPVWERLHLPPSTTRVAGPGRLGADLEGLPGGVGCPRAAGLEPGVLGRELCPGQKRGPGVGYSRKGKGSTLHLLTDGSGIPLAFLVTAANVSEQKVALAVVDRVRVPQVRGRPRQRPATLAADKGYDSVGFRRALWRRGIQSSIPPRVWPTRRRRVGRPPKIHPASTYRWKVERSFAWLDNWRRLVVRWEYHLENYLALTLLACIMFSLARILG